MNKRFIFLSVLLFMMGSVAAIHADDWPMWRHDAKRSGVSPEELANILHLTWSMEIAPARLAWPNEPRLHFDASIEPIVKGKLLFVGSPLDGSVRAYDTESGNELWKFYTEGPIRFAPVAWNDGLYIGSDDGFLYHLDATTGKLRWKVRGAPDERGDYRQLGNRRFISLWPVRGGPVIANGVVYFGAGIWPSMGVFVKAIDAKTGETKWSNGDISCLPKVKLDHNAIDEAALSPQGYCLFADSKVVVPNGRSMPARFEPETGKLLYFVQGYRNGDSRVSATDRLLFVGEQAVVSLEDGREVGDRWASAGKDAPNGYVGSKRDLFEGPFYTYKFIPACNYRSALDGGHAYGVHKGTLYGWDIGKAIISLYEKVDGADTLHPARWDAPPLWKQLSLDNGSTAPTDVIIKSGKQLYTHVGKTLLAVDLPGKDGEPKVAWRQNLEGTPTSMLTADGKLFVVLKEGRILCFGDKPVTAVKNHSLSRHVLANRGKDSVSSKRAIEALTSAGTDQGYALVLGLENGALVEALLEQSKMNVIAVDPDPEKVKQLRETLIAADLYASRAEVFNADPLSIKWPPYLASLVISERNGSSNLLAGMKASDLLELLRPYGGTAVAADGKVVRRLGALEGSADWTHECGDAARVYFSTDQRVQAPLGILWYGDGADYGFEKYKDYGRGVKPQVAKGRLVAFDDNRKELSAIDIYTGRLLWKMKTDTSLVRFVTFPDAVYVAHDLKCDVLNPETGEIQESLAIQMDIPERKKEGVAAVRANENTLLIGVGYDLPENEHSHQAMDYGLWDAKLLVALDRKNGKQLWIKKAEQRFNLHSIAMGGGMVFASDSISPSLSAEMDRRGDAPATFPSKVLALDERTGEMRWQKQYDYKFRNMIGRGPLAIRPYDDWQAYSAQHGLLLTGKSSEMRAIDVKTGEEIWFSNNAGLQPLILGPDNFINQAGHRYEITTGKLLTKKPLFIRSGCNYTVGSDSLLFMRYKSVAYIDLKKEQQFNLRNARSGCSHSLVAAGGLLNVPSFSSGCVCNYPIQTSFSLFHMPEAGVWDKIDL